MAGVILNSSPSLLGEGDRSRSEWWRGPTATAALLALPLRQPAAATSPSKLGEDL